MSKVKCPKCGESEFFYLDKEGNPKGVSGGILSFVPGILGIGGGTVESFQCHSCGHEWDMPYSESKSLTYDKHKSSDDTIHKDKKKSKKKNKKKKKSKSVIKVKNLFITNQEQLDAFMNGKIINSEKGDHENGDR